jgi:Spy/CpxP family protein refolding chaperone
MSRSIRFACASLALLVMAVFGSSFVSADDPSAQPPPARGPGGFGLMRGEELFLLRSEVVQKDLQLSDEQKSSIGKLYDQARVSLAGLQGLSQDERRTKMQELKKDQEEKIGGILDAKQKARVKEIELQQLGGFALADRTVAEALKLTDDQVNKIKVLNDGFNKEMRKAYQSWANGGDASAARDTLTKIFKEGSEKLMAILTDEQKASFEKMKGAKIDLPGAP